MTLELPIRQSGGGASPSDADSLDTERHDSPQESLKGSSAASSESSIEATVQSASESLLPKKPKSFWEGHVFATKDGNRWEIRQPLSKVNLHRDSCPSEAVQVFTCQCIEGPLANTGEMAVKVRFQINASGKTLGNRYDSLEELQDDLNDNPHNDKLRKNVEFHRTMLKWCTEPAKRLSRYTNNEIEALDFLYEDQCTHAPNLVDIAYGKAKPEMHKYAITDGYIVYLIMNKLPGEQLKSWSFHELPPDERENIRVAFKEALIAVQKSGIRLYDTDTDNILWDKENGKCYIVDFANCNTQAKCEADWEDRQWKSWWLAESCGRSH